jgi:hypothetical protein
MQQKSDTIGVFGPKMNEVLALIHVDSKFMRVTKLSIGQKPFQFNCRRWADLCCRLGGPPLTILDVERIEERGHSVKKFF